MHLIGFKNSGKYGKLRKEIAFELRRIQIEAQQAETRVVGEQQANIARAEGLRQANILEAQGEAEAIRIIDEQLRNNPNHLEWLKTQQWNGVLPLVTGGGGATIILMCF